MKRMAPQIGLLFMVLALLVACGGGTGSNSEKEKGTTSNPTVKPAAPREIRLPDSVREIFSKDSAYSWVAKQVAFGPRVPGTTAHRQCGDWMVSMLRNTGAMVLEQKGFMKGPDKKNVPIRNITARYYPEYSKRILICTHWDTRPMADQDPLSPDAPMDGANDGGSGTAVMLELARVLRSWDPGVGVDLVFFDAEDLGSSRVPDSYALGSQFWAKQISPNAQRPVHGILLDMVGAHDARFFREGVSRKYARPILDGVWSLAHELGYGSYFPYYDSPPITDDHYYVNQAGIPTIDIIHQDDTTPTGFGSFWHTTGDNMDGISAGTLGVVGHVVMEWLARQGQPAT